MLAITLVTFIPSVFIGLHMVRVSIFEVQADKYIAQVFNFPQTRVIESSKIYRRGGESPRIELLLVGGAARRRCDRECAGTACQLRVAPDRIGGAPGIDLG